MITADCLQKRGTSHIGRACPELADKLGDYAAKYGITTAGLTDIKDSANDFDAMLHYADALDGYGQNITA